MKLTDCYFEKKDWRACQKEVSVFLWLRFGHEIQTYLLTIQYRCKYSKNAGNVTVISNEQEQKICKDRGTIVKGLSKMVRTRKAFGYVYYKHGRSHRS